jgi:hypothetical protein
MSSAGVGRKVVPIVFCVCGVGPIVEPHCDLDVRKFIKHFHSVILLTSGAYSDGFEERGETFGSGAVIRDLPEPKEGVEGQS